MRTTIIALLSLYATSTSATISFANDVVPIAGYSSSSLVPSSAPKDCQNAFKASIDCDSKYLDILRASKEANTGNDAAFANITSAELDSVCVSSCQGSWAKWTTDFVNACSGSSSSVSSNKDQLADLLFVELYQSHCIKDSNTQTYCTFEQNYTSPAGFSSGSSFAAPSITNLKINCTDSCQTQLYSMIPDFATSGSNLDIPGYVQSKCPKVNVTELAKQGNASQYVSEAKKGSGAGMVTASLSMTVMGVVVGVFLV